MSIRATTRIAFALFLLGICSAQSADESLFTPREGDLLLGPISRNIPVEGILIETRVAAFLRVLVDQQNRQIRARVVADLAELNSKIDHFVRLLPLPKDNCARRGQFNPVVNIQRSALAVQGRQATIQLWGELRVWSCLDNPLPPPLSSGPIKTEVLPVLKFQASLPFTLQTDGALSVALSLETPSLDFRGAWGDVTDTVLTLAGVNVSRVFENLLKGALRPEDFRASIPEEFLPLEPRIIEAQFFSNSGTLAAEIELSVNLPTIGIADAGVSAGPSSSTPPSP